MWHCNRECSMLSVKFVREKIGRIGMSYKFCLTICGSIIVGATFVVPQQSFSQGVQVTPGMVGGTPQPNATNPPSNPSQLPTPSAPGATVTYPNNPPTKVKCTRDGK